MEEKKIVGKEVKLQPLKKEGSAGENTQKLSYEELNNACTEMSQQVQQQGVYIQKLHKQLQEMSMMLQTKRMDYLFKIVEMSNSCNEYSKYCFDSEIVLDCVKEIQESLFPPAEEKKEDSMKEE